MSVYASEVTLMNVTNADIVVATLRFQPQQPVVIWDTKSASYSQVTEETFETVRGNHAAVTSFIESGALTMTQDSVDLQYAQALIVLTQMYEAWDKAQTLSQLQSPGVRTDSLKEDDGRQLVTNTPIGIGWNVFFTGYDDDPVQFALYKQNPSLPSGRGEGRPFLLQIDGALPDPTMEEFQFVEPVHIHDGEVNWGPDGAWSPTQDHFSIGIRFVATAVTATPGAGNCRLISVATGLPVTSVSGAEVIVPANNGDFTVNLADACPIRSTNRTGYWRVNENNGRVLAGRRNAAPFDLFTFAPADVWMMKRIATSNSKRIMEPDVYRTEMIHPNWKIIISATKLSPGIGWLTGWFTAFRKNVQ